jgi:hypothetical protein
MNEEELAGAWTTLEPTHLQRRRMEARVVAWLDARDSPLTAEWLRLFRGAPFATVGLAGVSAFSVLTATPVLWVARALI